MLSWFLLWKKLKLHIPSSANMWTTSSASQCILWLYVKSWYLEHHSNSQYLYSPSDMWTLTSASQSTTSWYVKHNISFTYPFSILLQTHQFDSKSFANIGNTTLASHALIISYVKHNISFLVSSYLIYESQHRLHSLYLANMWNTASDSQSSIR